jgi:hypothetical protein
MYHGFKSAHLLNFDSYVQSFKSHSQKRSRFAAWYAMLAIALFGTWNLAKAQTKTSTTTTTTLAVTSASGAVTTVTS